jgi:hypothetical protein
MLEGEKARMAEIKAGGCPHPPANYHLVGVSEPSAEGGQKL